MPTVASKGVQVTSKGQRGRAAGGPLAAAGDRKGSLSAKSLEERQEKKSRLDTKKHDSAPVDFTLSTNHAADNDTNPSSDGTMDSFTTPKKRRPETIVKSPPFLTPMRKRQDPFPTAPKGPRTPLQRGQVKILVEHAGMRLVNGNYKPKSRYLWQKRVTATTPMVPPVGRGRGAPKNPSNSRSQTDEMVIPPLLDRDNKRGRGSPQNAQSQEWEIPKDTDGVLQIAFYEDLLPGQCGWALSYIPMEIDSDSSPGSKADPNSPEWSLKIPTLPPIGGGTEQHLYFCPTDAPPEDPNYVPFKGWQTAQCGKGPTPRFRRVEISKNSETVMNTLMAKLQKCAEKDRRYSKTDLLSARIYFQDKPNVCQSGNFHKNLFMSGVNKTSSPIFKLLDEERIDRRRKQIDIGKQTPEYQAYIEAIPKDRRPKGAPVTPPLLPKRSGYDVSKRRYTGMVRAWRRHLHTYEIPPPEEIALLPPRKKIDSPMPKYSTSFSSSVRRRPKPEPYDDLGRVRNRRPLMKTPPRFGYPSPASPQKRIIPMVSPQKQRRRPATEHGSPMARIPLPNQRGPRCPQTI